MKNILITGAAGFIGSSLIMKLSKSFKIYGIDNLNSYYDKKLKLDRLKLIKSKILFYKIDLSKKKDLKSLFQNKKFDIVIHFAAQAGVRYSFEHPESYIESNIIGTNNLMECLKLNPPEHFIFASSSSVYGLNSSKQSFKETSSTNHAVSLYAASKVSCESIIHNYSYNYKIPSTILRFFTVYGPWGRPDMALFKFTKRIIEDKPINVFNSGRLWRDFTYIDDLTKSIQKLIFKKPKPKSIKDENNNSFLAPFRVLNIGNQKPIRLDQFINCLENVIGKPAIKNFKPMQKGDVVFTKSNCKSLKELIGYVPNTNIEIGIKEFYKWYKKYYQ